MNEIIILNIHLIHHIIDRYPLIDITLENTTLIIHVIKVKINPSYEFIVVKNKNITFTKENK